MNYIFIAGIVYLISKHSISFSIRSWIYGKAEDVVTDKGVQIKGFWGFIYKLISCPFCLGFWIGIIVFSFVPVQGTFIYAFLWCFKQGIITAIISYAASRD